MAPTLLRTLLRSRFHLAIQFAFHENVWATFVLFLPRSKRHGLPFDFFTTAIP